MLMLIGLSLIPTLTSVVVSALVSKIARRQREQDLLLFQEQSARMARIEERLTVLDRPPGP